MSVDTVLSAAWAFIEFSVRSYPGLAVDSLLAAVAAVAWAVTLFGRWMVGYVVYLARVTAAGLSTAVFASALLVAFAALTG